MRAGAYLFLVSWFIAMGCDPDESEPVYPPEPFVENGVLKFIEDSNPGISFDTLQLTFEFRDGDFDLGLNAMEIDSPYHRADFFLEDQGTLKRITPQVASTNFPVLIDPGHHRSGKLATYSHLKKVMQPPSLSCTDYIFEGNVAVRSTVIDPSYHITDTVSNLLGSLAYILMDTFLIAYNPNNYNIFVDYLVEQPDGTFRTFDWLAYYCDRSITGPFPFFTYNGRFPLLMGEWNSPVINLGPFRIVKRSNQKGILTYKMTGAHFNALFGGKKIKLAFFIQDRALNRSNVAETPVIEIPQ